MNCKCFLACLTVALVLSVVPTLPAVLAQEAAPLPIAIVNMDRVFKTYPPLLEKLAPIKEAAQELAKKEQLRAVEIETLVAKIRMAQPGSPEQQRMQQQAAELQGELQQLSQKERGELQQREAAIFLDLYRQMEDEVRKYAQAKGIKLVLRQQDSSLDAQQSVVEILKSLNRGIIYEDGLDITDEMLKALDARNAAGATKP
ncbi:MAG: OmpH family outer membrane protein [Pirellulaceae bacterium]